MCERKIYVVYIRRMYGTYDIHTENTEKHTLSVCLKSYRIAQKNH